MCFYLLLFFTVFFCGYQNSSSSTLNYGPGSRTLPAVPERAYYNILGQNQQYAGYQQVQQPSQRYGALEYSDFYGSQTGMTREHQRRNYGGLTNGGIQDRLSQQSNQFWRKAH